MGQHNKPKSWGKELLIGIVIVILFIACAVLVFN